MSILLVHGACHGAWCWERVVPLLAARGHHVKTVDLPGRPSGGGRAGWGQTLQGYAQAIAQAAATFDTPVVALGHSMGAQMISAAAELAPRSFARLVYLSAFLPRDGDTIATFAQHNHGSGLPGATQVSLLRGSFRILLPEARGTLYQDCAQDDVAAVLPRLALESLRPSLARIRLTNARFGRVPKSYIRLTEDRAITPALQDWMLGRQDCERVLALRSSHSPFYAMPDGLVAAIEDAAH